MKMRSRHLLSLSASFLVLAAGSLRAATTYTYGGSDSSSGNLWSTTTWSPTPGTGGPGSAGSGTTDIASIGLSSSAAANQTVTYDSGASGFLGGLLLGNSSSIYTNTLDIQKSLTVSSAMTFGGAGSGPIQIILDDLNAGVSGNSQVIVTNSLITLESNATLEMAGGTVTAANTPTIAGALTIAGGTLNLDESGDGAAIDPKVTGLVTMTSGNIVLNATPTVGTGNKDSLTFTSAGGLQMTGGTISVASGQESASNIIGLGGAASSTSYIAGGTFDAGIGIQLTGGANTTTAFYTSVALGSISFGNAGQFEDFGASNGTNGFTSAGTAIIGMTANGIPGSVSFNFGSSRAQTLTLQSNVTSLATNAMTVTGTSNGHTGTIDLDGHTLDMSAATNSFDPSPGGNLFVLESSTGTGVIKAFGYNFSGGSLGSTIGGGSGTVTVEATGVSANNLGNANGGTIAANSTFYYAPITGSNASVGSLTSNRTIGALHVGYGGTATGSLLQLVGGLTTAGNVQVDSGSILDVNANTLALQGTSVLTGAGTIISSVAGGAITFGTGGLQPGSAPGSTVAQALSFSGTAGTPLTLTLNSTSTSTFNIDNATTFDHILLGANASIVYGGSLVLDFTGGYDPTNGTSFDLFNGANGSNSSGSFTSITDNLSGDSWTLSNGVLTVDNSNLAVPEPSTVSLMIGALFLGLLAWRMRRGNAPVSIL